ncbi:hypothetical protein H920_01615 [Fukomys damarensis]|uniref:Uncharacterized protein n=1 Tax=Fukomys damarensis TaxID=885580 RepID=A0A091E2N0_FUKDA|nr:hypothetical protein H920_01615 [Fukomys damarensis]
MDRSIGFPPKIVMPHTDPGSLRLRSLEESTPSFLAPQQQLLPFAVCRRVTSAQDPQLLSQQHRGHLLDTGSTFQSSNALPPISSPVDDISASDGTK